MLHGSAEWCVVRGNGLNPKKSSKRNIKLIKQGQIPLAKLSCLMREELLRGPKQNWVIQRGEIQEAKPDRFFVTRLTAGGIFYKTVGFRDMFGINNWRFFILVILCRKQIVETGQCVFVLMMALKC